MSEHPRTTGFPVFAVLGLIFVTLKLCGVIDWSWWWVTAPFWGGFVFLFLVLGLAAAVIAAVRVFVERTLRR